MENHVKIEHIFIWFTYSISGQYMPIINGAVLVIMLSSNKFSSRILQLLPQ